MSALSGAPAQNTPSSCSKGQGAFEFVVLLSAVLIIVMVSVVLLASAPNSGTDLRSSTSATYWSSQAAPFLIPKHALSSDGILTLVLMNSGSSPLKLSQIDVSGNGIGAPYAPYGTCNGRKAPVIAPLEIDGGRRVNLSINLSGSCVSGAAYELWINMTYSNMDSILPARQQVGLMPLVGRCGSSMYAVYNGSLLPNGAACSISGDCLSTHCKDTGGGKICVECIGDGHCLPPCTRCENYVCKFDD